ncbi:neuropeptide Y receptor type 5 [Protopterus annectens]|uniref:neuropeptide Y receptor type 5 n=1 Tax=Protopterus annectens TaxID=7888 RepID=UPI001CFC1B09|nr:neuropeptide Y receptor type 5 [Protopterus annectens]XP_043918152.1 neuropeptide Y receptor type 5 [Protopterus annectens]
MALDYRNRSNINATVDGNVTSSHDPKYPSWEDFSSVEEVQYALIGLYTFVSLLGLLGNVLVLVVLVRKWKQKTMMNFLVGNLAFSDILVVLFCSPSTLTYVLLDQWIFGELMCHIVPFIQCVSVMVSTLMLMSIAMVRYIMVKHPLSNHLTANTGYLVLGITWGLGFAICSPLPVFYKTEDLSQAFNLQSWSNKYLCIESWPSGKYRIVFTMCLLFIQYILPLACLIICHAIVCRSISSRVLNRDTKMEENEMINLTLHQPEKNGSQPQISHVRRWSYSFVRKHKKRYSRKCASVVPAMSKNHRGASNSGELLRIPATTSDQNSPSGLFLPGVPVCFDIKPEESSKSEKALTTTKPVSRMKKRSRSVFYKLTIIILAFAVSWLPLHLFHLVTDFNENLISNQHFKIVYCTCHLLGMLSCCLNPLLYGFLNNGIKTDVLSLVKCCHLA